MDELKPLAVFAETVAAGSMSAAARRLGMSPSAVSQTIRGLERAGGVVLLHRSTRKLALTAAGERYYPHCRRLLEAARAAADALQEARDAPVGELRVSAPVGFAMHLAEALAPLLAESPALRLSLSFDDALIDLIDARIDVALRVGRLADTSWVSRRLGDMPIILCASPDYLARRPAPKSPAELPAHQWLGMGQKPRARLDFQHADGRQEQVDIEARILSNNMVALTQLCEQGLGVARLGLADVRPSLERGTLVRLLPAWRLPVLPVWSVTPRRDEVPAKVRAALTCLKRYFARPPVTPG